MLAELFLRLQLDLRTLDIVGRPIDTALFQVVQADSLDRRVLVVNFVLGMLAPVRRGRNDDPTDKLALLPGSRKEGIDMRLLDRGIGIVTLALDGNDAGSVQSLGNEVDSGIGLAIPTGPIRPTPDLAELLFVDRLIQEILPYQFLEAGSLVHLGGFGVAYLVENGVNRGHNAVK